MLLNETIISKKKLINNNRKQDQVCCMPRPFYQTYSTLRGSSCNKSAYKKKYILEDLLNINESSLQSACLYL